MHDNGPLTFKCWSCTGEPQGCQKCGGTGRLFYAYGRSYPYTPEGEKRCLKAIEREENREDL
jgi:hypothetical protein